MPDSTNSVGLVRYHGQVASGLRKAGHVSSAIDEYETALKVDEKDWLARSGLAVSYALRNDFHLAIETAKGALDAVPEEDKSSQSNLYSNLGLWYREIEETDLEIEAVRKALAIKPHDLQHMAHRFGALGRAERFGELYSFAEELDSTVPSGFTDSYLIQLLLGWDEGHDLFGRAAKAERKTEFAVQKFRQAILSVEAKDGPSTAYEQFQLGRLYYRHLDNEDQAIARWKDMISPSARFGPLGNSYAKQLVSKPLGEIYLRKAYEARMSRVKSEETQCVQEMEALAKEGSPGLYTTSDASMMLGLWYRHCGETAMAEECFKPKILEGIDLLQDEDPSNDIDGYLTLAKTLLLAGDLENARAAADVTLLPLKYMQQPRSTTTETSRSVNPHIAPSVLIWKRNSSSNSKSSDDSCDLKFLYVCEGRCRNPAKRWTQLWICVECIDVTLCDQCYEKHKDANIGLPFRVCDQRHDFVQAYPPGPVPMLAAIQGEDGKLKPNKNWLRELEKYWSGGDKSASSSAKRFDPRSFKASWTKPQRERRKPTSKATSMQHHHKSQGNPRRAVV